MTSKLSTPNCGSASQRAESAQRNEIIDRVVPEAVAAALDEHRRMGRSVPIWRDEKVVWIGPEEIGEILKTREESTVEIDRTSIQGEQC